MGGKRGKRLRRLALLSGFLLAPAVMVPVAVHALSLADIRSQGQAIGTQLRRLQESDQLDPSTEQRLTERLGGLVLGFIEQSDRAIRTGSEQRGRSARRSAFEAVHAPLDRLYTSRSQELERMARVMMDEDGDLEALYETPAWQESQAVAAQSLYFLNWLNYYGARLYEGTRRRDLLQAAQRGFSEFTVGEQQTDLLTESLLGRGLCHLELGNYPWARRDLGLVIEQPNVSAERKAKAGLALLDSYARSGKVEAALRHSEELLSGGSLVKGDLAVVRFYRLQALFDALDQAKGARADRYRGEAERLMDRLRRAGKGWAEKVDALMVTRIDDPSAWVAQAKTPKAQWELAKLLMQKDDYEAALPLLKQVVHSDRPQAKPYQHEARYWLGVSHFKAGEYPAAAEQLNAALAAGNSDFAAEAMFLRFKALEAIMTQEATPTVAERYEASLRELLEKHAEHPLAYEAQYRLAEYQQANGDLAAALDGYAKVAGDPEFELRARFGALQSRFELLRQRPVAAERDSLLDAIGQEIERFWQQAKTLEAENNDGDLQLQELMAKATLLQAVYLSLRGNGGGEKTAVVLAGFAQRFPQQAELLPQAIRLRLAVLLQLGRFSEAEEEVKQHAAALREEERRDAIEKLASGFMQAGARREAAGDSAAAQAASRVALRLYEVLNGSGGPASAQRQLAMARLHESTDNQEAAVALYMQVLDTNSNSLAALRGLARVAELQRDTAEALGHWTTYTKKTRPGGSGWFRGQYERARLTLASGDRHGACKLLTELRPTMPGLRDAELRAELAELYEEACD